MRLQSERLVFSTALRGFSVAPLSRKEMQDATETRILIECEALRLSMRDGDDDWEAGIVAAFHALSLQVERQSRISGEVNVVDMHAMDERHYQFHRALIARCGSQRLLDMADQLYVETQRYRLPCLIGRVAGAQTRDVAAEHQQLMDATLRRSEDAVHYLAEHYRRTAAIIEASTVWPSPA
jgi:DNA-binding GntR family transcriptional regulator